MIASLATLGVGILIGYMGQRSKFCTVSGIRDYLMLKDSYRLKGLLGIIAGGAIGYTAFRFLGGDIPNFPLGIGIESKGILIASIIGGAGMGFFSVFAEGCPFRQHVMAAEGKTSALFYLLGFYIGIVYFNIVTVKWLELLLRFTG
ncbi:MAG: hypothetical protein A2144_11565 [Chloroflexi bacterium RBG_16_50_9]|nr:MAG: hypothetical protein A2144_11565 [Chloroflexi bacterium RBG_16_50_9]